jgi:hypothetical protein
MNQEPRWVRLVEKSRGQKSRATVPLTPNIKEAKTVPKMKLRGNSRVKLQEGQGGLSGLNPHRSEVLVIVRGGG